MFTHENYIEWLKLSYIRDEEDLWDVEDDHPHTYGGWELMWSPEAVPHVNGMINRTFKRIK